MAILDTFLLRVKRGETPFYRALRRVGYTLLRFNLPLPRVLRPVFSFLYGLHFGIWQAFRTVASILYCEPLFRARCVSAGQRLHVALLPRFEGQPRVTVGNDVKLHGLMRVVDACNSGAELILEDGAEIGHNVTFLIARRVVVGSGAGIASECFVSDFESLSSSVSPESPEKGSFVRIGARAWIGRGCAILKGVTVGEAAIVGTGSVLTDDVPPHSVAMGNPARIVVRSRPEPASAGQIG